MDMEKDVSVSALNELRERWLPGMAKSELSLLAAMEKGDKAIEALIEKRRRRGSVLLGIQLISAVALIVVAGYLRVSSLWGVLYFGSLLFICEYQRCGVLRDQALLRPISTAAQLCEAALGAVERYTTARSWRDGVVGQGRRLRILDGEVIERLAQVEQAKLEEELQAQRCKRLHGLEA